MTALATWTMNKAQDFQQALVEDLSMFSATYLCCELAFRVCRLFITLSRSVNSFLMVFPLFRDNCDRDFGQLAAVIVIFSSILSAIHLALMHCQLTVVLIAIFTVIILKIF